MIVVDASVALKWFLIEPGAEEARRLVETEIMLLAPDLLVAEVCNGAWRAARMGRLTAIQVARIARVLPGYFRALPCPPGGPTSAPSAA